MNHYFCFFIFSHSRFDTLWAPSLGNTQPWEIVPVAGEPLEKFKLQNREALLAGKVSHPDIPMPEAGPDPDAPVNRFERLGGGDAL